MKAILLMVVSIALSVPALAQKQDERIASNQGAPNAGNSDHVRLSTPVVKAWRNLDLESPVYTLTDLSPAKDWLEHAFIQPISLQYGIWHIWIEPGYAVFRIYPYISKDSPRPSIYQGIVLKVNGDMSVDALVAAIRNRTSTVKIDEFEIYGGAGLNLQKYSRRHGGLEVWPDAEGGNPRPLSSVLQLAINAQSPQQFYWITDELQLETYLRNVGGSDLYLFDYICWNPGSLLNIHVFDMAGKEVSGNSGFLRDCLPPPPQPNDTSRFRLLAPGAAYTDTETFSIAELVPKPGEYDLIVYYHSAISRDWIREYGGEKLMALPIWTSEVPTIESNKLHIVVKR
ncbi:MAG TPA: hypothetical protein VGJ51_00655 [Candidatus Angelobacter sp.]